MVEYGNGVGQATGAGGGGGAAVGGHEDVLARLGTMIDNGIDTIAALPPEILLAGIVVIFLGLVILKRAF